MGTSGMDGSGCMVRIMFTPQQSGNVLFGHDLSLPLPAAWTSIVGGIHLRAALWPDAGMRFLLLIFFAFGVVTFGGVATRADIVHLKDGTSVEGNVKRSDDGWDVIDAAGHAVHVSSAAVKQIELSARSSDPEVALSHLDSLRNSVENSADLKQIIDRFQKFIEQNK